MYGSHMGTNTTDLSTIPTGAEMMAHPVLEDFIAAFGLDSPTIRACIREYDMMLAGPDGDAVRAMHEAGYLVQVMPSDTHDWEPRFVATRHGYLGARRVGMLMARAGDYAIAHFAFSQRTIVVCAAIFNRIDCAIDVEQGDGNIIDIEYLPSADRHFIGCCYFNKVCHNFNISILATRPIPKRRLSGL